MNNKIASELISLSKMLLANDFVNLDVNDDLKKIAVEFGVMNHHIQPLFSYLRLSDEKAETKDIAKNLNQIYEHALETQSILDSVEDKLEAFQREL